jgi:hypothetical protein
LSSPTIRRNRVNEVPAVGIAAAAGVLAALSGARPTGSTAIDLLMVAVAIGAVTWAAASAPWWAVAAIAGLAGAIALSPVLAAIGFAAFGAGLWIGVRQRDLSETRGLVAGVGLNVLIRSELHSPLGLSAAIGITAAVVLLWLGLRRRRSAIRRVAWPVLGACGAVLALSAAGIGVAANAARTDLTDGNRLARQGLSAVNRGDYDLAVERFRAANSSFVNADTALSRPWAMLGRLVPGVAQNARAADQLAEAAAMAANDAANALTEVNIDNLAVIDGRIDVAAVEATLAPLNQARSALDQLRVTVDGVASPWLLEPLQRRLDDLDDDLDENEELLLNAIEAVELAPGFLGADGLRRYLVLFTTPAEARNLGGFTGNYAEVTVDNGAIVLARFGRIGELSRAAFAQRARCDGCPPDFLRRYGRFGFTTANDGPVRPWVWSNIAVSPQFPDVAQVASILYPQSGGDELHGVAVMDPYVIEALMGYTGAIDLEGLGVTVRPDTAAEFILRDQYLIEDGDERIDALDELGRAVFVELLTGALPGPVDIASDLGPLVAERRLLLWTPEATEQQFLDRAGLLGAIPQPGDAPGFAVTVHNAGESKIDVFHRQTVDSAVVTGADGRRWLDATVTLTNEAPAGGLPRIVIGNNRGLPLGTSRLLVTFFGPPGLQEILLDGKPTGAEALRENGWTAYSQYVNIGPGGTVEYQLSFALPAGCCTTDEVVTWHQPLVREARQ